MPYATVKDNFQKINKAKINVLKQIGHMPPVEAADEFNNLVTGFLKGGKHGRT